jgi:tRNA1Val (adenine37-N6)-methyltransferase
MKVCTDSCLFGAWVASIIRKDDDIPKTTLDIGAGTGLLSMMLAQKINGQIDAAEIDENAFRQCAENFRESPWNERLKAFQADIKIWKSPYEYDLIISNPPFYENDLLPSDAGKNISKHSSRLGLNDLLSICANLLKENGKFAVLLPYHRSAFFERAASSFGLFTEEWIDVKQTNAHNYFRTMLVFGKKNVTAKKDKIIISNNGNEYTKEFTELLKDYYLHL